MNINIYLEDSLGKNLNQYATQLGKTRNAIVREAVKEWIQHHQTAEWPNSILTFSGVKNFESFESHRTDLAAPNEDPLA